MYIPGAAVAGSLSPEHPLAAGLDSPPATLVQGDRVLLPSGDPRLDVLRVPAADHVIRYAVELVRATRPAEPGAADFVKENVSWGAGPRASQNLVLGAKAHAAVDGRFSPDIQDVKAVAMGILRHRILWNYKVEAEGVSDEDIVRQLL